MPGTPLSSRVLEHEARALLTRLARVEPFALHMPMVPAAALSPAAQTAIEHYLARGRRELRARTQEYLRWLTGGRGQQAPPAEAQRRFTFLKLRFNAVLSQFHIFADVVSQRGEHETGVWLSGLDAVAADALLLPNCRFEAPPVVCYLDHSPGAAIRRARTRLPGGGENPVAIVRVPRERMIGSGLASSLVHEVGHQGSVLLDLIGSLRPALREMQRTRPREEQAWSLFERWISEILADFWSVAKLGITATMGLMGVVSLPRAFVFRLSLEDPHPVPWIRVKLSCAMGRALYPHPQWDRLGSLWESFYPRGGLDDERQDLFDLIEESMPDFVSLLINHQPARLGGQSLKEAMSVDERRPARLTALHRQWLESPRQMLKAAPALAFAVIGQARADGNTTPEEESKTLSYLLTHWALQTSAKTSAACAATLAARSCEARQWTAVEASPNVH